MRRFSEYLDEKLHVSKSMNASSDLSREILESFCISDNDGEIASAISSWVDANLIDKVFYYANLETLREAMKEGMPWTIAKKFGFDGDDIMDCQDELDRCEEIVDDGDITILANGNMIACLNHTGAMYCTREEIYNIVKRR